MRQLMLAFALALLALTLCAEEARAPIPDAAQLKEAEKTIKDIFKEEYAKRAADDKKALGLKLLQQALETKDDAVSRYVLLKEASANAAAGGDAETALQALQLLGQHYDVDAGALKVEALARIVPASPDAAKSLTRVYLKAIDDAVSADSYDAAVKLASAAETAARKTQDMPLATQVAARGKEVRALQADFAKVKTAQTTLKEKPDDPDANLAVGKFLCFSKEQWEQGLPLLAKGSDAALKAVSEKDLGAPLAAQERATIGDEWAAAATRLGASAKKGIQRRAIRWYALALKDMTGLQRAKYEKLLKEASAAFPRTLPAWISSKATYKASSVRNGWEMPDLLNGTGGGAYNNQFAFHTEDPATIPPYIVIDLKSICFINDIEIVNRNEGKERAKTLTIWVGHSNEGPWDEVWTAADVKLEWRITLAAPRVAQFVKIGLKEKNPLHLFSVKVFGEPME